MWSPNGRFLHLPVKPPSLNEIGKTRVVPLPQGKMLPDLPSTGMIAADEPELFPGSQLVEGYAYSPSPDPSVFAYVKTRLHRNLFRIPLRFQ